MSERLSPYARIHKSATTGIDAYEEAWDVAAAVRWQLLGFNLLWFFGFIVGWILLKILSVFAGFEWTTIIFVNLIYLLLFFPTWELANILKFRLNKAMSMHGVVNLAIARVIYTSILLVGYLCFIIPGIYLHCRLILHMPILARDQRSLGVTAMGKSWRITKGRVVTLYALWIVTVLSKPVCALPLGLGFVLERPLSGFAKEILLASFDVGPQANRGK